MRQLAALCLVAMAAGTQAQAHALDEYVQAVRVGIAASGLTFHLDLTPGVSIAPAVSGRIDANADGRFSEAEAKAYGLDVLRDLTVTRDGSVLGLALERVDLPAFADMLSGQSVIRIEARAAIQSDAAHHVTLRNDHYPAISAYLANALKPDTPEIRIVSQARDVRQQTFVVHYQIARGTSPVAWTAGAGLALVLLAGMRGLVWKPKLRRYAGDAAFRLQ
jgi:hypothetical protein